MGFDAMRWTRLRSAWHEAQVVGAEHGDGVFDFGEHVAEADHETRQDKVAPPVKTFPSPI